MDSFATSALVLGLALLGGANLVEGASPSAGCGSAQSGVQVGQTTNVTLADGRWYLLYVPEKYAPGTPAPLVLSYHGGNRNASEQQALDMLSTAAFNEDHVVAYPNGIDVSCDVDPTEQPRCSGPPPSSRLERQRREKRWEEGGGACGFLSC